MPSTVNGIGTWYYGKSNLVTRNDRCEFCGAYVELKSFDTTLYFVVVFIPLLPLSRKRVLDQCPNCRKHRAMKLSKWEEQKSTSILKATEAWQQDRPNKQKAIDAVGTSIAFHDVDSFHHLAGVVGQTFARDADVQIFLGSAYSHFGEPGAAEEAYRAALLARPDDASREALARYYIRENRPNDAAALLDHIVPNRARDKAMLLLALASAYQAVGNHESAWKIVDDVGTTFPDLLSDPEYDRVRRSVSKYRGTDKRVGDKSKRTGARQTSWLQRHLGMVIVGGVLLVAAIWYLGVAFSLGTHNVSLVNGTAVAYTVNINNTPYSLPANGHLSVSLPEGTLSISAPNESNRIPPATVSLRTNFFSRPMHRHTFVINPDRTAVVFWEQTQYSNDPGRIDIPHRYYAGDVLYDIDKVDYVFEDFPDKLKVEDVDKTATKTRVDMMSNVDADLRADVIKNHVSAEAAAQWAKRYALFSDKLDAVAVLSEYVPPAEQLEYLRAHLADRPIRVEWHRMYQQRVQVEQPAYDVIGEYRQLLKSNPADSTMMYLLARTLDDRDEAVALFRKSEESTPTCGYASFALSYDLMMAAKFEEALQHAECAVATAGDNPVFCNAAADALEALGRYDSAIAMMKRTQGPEGRDFGLVAREVNLLAAKGDLPAANARIDEACKLVDKLSGGRAELVATERNVLESGLNYVRGNVPAFVKSCAGIKGPGSVFGAAISVGRVDDARKSIAEIEPARAFENLVLFIVAKKAGKDAIAGESWSKAMELMRKSSRSDRRFAESLKSSSPPTDKALRDWSSEPAERVVMLVALGLRHPEKQNDYFTSARALNYSRQFPYLLIDAVTK